MKGKAMDKRLIINIVAAPYLLLKHCFFGIATTAVCLTQKRETGSDFEKFNLALLHLIVGIAEIAALIFIRFKLCENFPYIMLVASLITLYCLYIPFYTSSEKLIKKGEDLMEYAGEAMSFGAIAFGMTFSALLSLI